MGIQFRQDGSKELIELGMCRYIKNLELLPAFGPLSSNRRELPATARHFGGISGCPAELGHVTHFRRCRGFLVRGESYYCARIQWRLKLWHPTQPIS